MSLQENALNSKTAISLVQQHRASLVNSTLLLQAYWIRLSLPVQHCLLSRGALEGVQHTTQNGLYGTGSLAAVGCEPSDQCSAPQGCQLLPC